MVYLRGRTAQRTLQRTLSKQWLQGNTGCAFCWSRHFSDQTSFKSARPERTRAEAIEHQQTAFYPRLQSTTLSNFSVRAVNEKWGFLLNNEYKPDALITIRGRIHRIRVQSSKLIFYDLVEDNSKIQIVLERNSTGASDELFSDCANSVRRGDIVAVRGYPVRSSRGDLSLKATSLIRMLAPTLNDFPKDDAIGSAPRHVQLFKDLKVQQVLRLRSVILTRIRSFFLARDFVEVQTPIMSPRAGGATAKPFVTDGDKLVLRVAPELWLKRLTVGGMERIFELGPSFRNEGVDHTHNPEFTTCEFYEAYATLEDLMSTTESLISELMAAVLEARQAFLTQLPDLDPRLDETAFKKPFRRLDFIKGIEEAVNIKLPDLESQGAANAVFRMMRDELKVPGIPEDQKFIMEYRTLPWLLDKLASVYLEPQCIAPTFITNIPACMSPLSKSSIRDEDSQRVSHRAELFMLGMEVCNAYEEENSPFAQREKFMEQVEWKYQKLHTDENQRPPVDREKMMSEMVDEAYVSALEWGMPPTGGWGLGIDRICMLLSGSTKIGDVLSFGGMDGVRRATAIDMQTANALKIQANASELKAIKIHEENIGKKIGTGDFIRSV